MKEGDDDADVMNPGLALRNLIDSKVEACVRDLSPGGEFIPQYHVGGGSCTIEDLENPVVGAVLEYMVYR